MKISAFRNGLILMAVAVLTAVIHAEVKLPALFGNSMVLQQKSNVTVWGWAEPGEKVTVKADWSRSAKSDRADKEGKWSIKLKTPSAGGPHTLTVSGNNSITLNDLLIGEVWVCSGQSNMEYTMAWLLSDAVNADIAKANYPQMRLFTVKKAIAAEPLTDVEGAWQACSPDVVANFSATSYYFGQKLHKELNVPIGLVSTNWGGTPAEAWASKEALSAFSQFKDQIEPLGTSDHETAAKQAYQRAVKDWEDKVAALDAGMQEEWFSPYLDDSGWKEMELPALWTGAELEPIDGILWFRRVTNLPPSWAHTDMELHLGPIDDIATIWFNGVNIGTTFGWNTPRVYQIPASALHVGKNTLAVRVIDTGGKGGFGGKEEDMRIGPLGADVKTCATVAQTWKYKVSAAGAVPTVPTNLSAFNQNTPTTLYNGMIAPLIPFRIAGAIWYQGESNCYDPILYRCLLPAMIADWRQQWNQGDFPFYYVQIAPYQYDNQTCSQAVREAQLMTLNASPNVGMAVTMDIGEEKDVHPKNKQDVGDRLARWALAKTYGQKDIVYSGPVCKKMKIEDDKIRVMFDYIDGGLMAKDGTLSDFMIAGDDKNFVPARAVIDGDTVVVSSQAVPNPVAVRYGWSNWVSGTLFNKAGLPASSFRTDDWPLQ
ncbi:MAG: hypothetical protein L0Y36_10215 [Planctomycetales bacterium]|nr:hypothetical protein [Planctomycetales bacterium]